MRQLIFVFVLLTSLCACSPKFDWRDVRDEENHFQILMPGKAANAQREIDLDGLKVNMKMTGTEVQNINFLIAYVHLPVDANDPENSKKQQLAALNAMKVGMLRNIQGQWQKDPQINTIRNTDVALGLAPNGKKLKMLGRFEQRADYLVQVVMLSEESSFNLDAAEMFFDSYKWHP
mgnify:CR=1 FL=1